RRRRGAEAHNSADPDAAGGDVERPRRLWGPGLGRAAGVRRHRGVRHGLLRGPGGFAIRRDAAGDAARGPDLGTDLALRLAAARRPVCDRHVGHRGGHLDHRPVGSEPGRRDWDLAYPAKPVRAELPAGLHLLAGARFYRDLPRRPLLSIALAAWRLAAGNPGRRGRRALAWGAGGGPQAASLRARGSWLR